MKKLKTKPGVAVAGKVIKIVRHTVDGNTGEHRQWRVENYGTDEEKEIEIFKGDPDWEE